MTTSTPLINSDLKEEELQPSSCASHPSPLILYFIPRYDRAAMGNRIHSEVIEAWRDEGVSAEVLTLDTTVRHLTSANEEGIIVHRLPVSSGLIRKVANRALGGIFHYPYLAGALGYYRRFIARQRFDLVHIETAFPLGLVAALGGRHSPPLAITLPGADVMAEPEFDYGYGRFRAVRAMLRLVFRRAVVLRADSPQIRALALRLGASPDKTVAIPYNITADSYPPPGSDIAALRERARAAVCARHALDPAHPLLASLSRLHPFKGVAYLVEALPLLRTGGHSPHVLIVGPSRTTPSFGDYGDYLARRAADLAVSDAITFTGGVDHAATRDYLAAADVVIVPSVAESFNRVAIEAAAVGTPVVVTRTTGVSDYVKAEGSGLVVAPRSGPDIAAAILLLLNDRGLWHNCSSQALRMAAQFSSAAIARELLHIYRLT